MSAAHAPWAADNGVAAAASRRSGGSDKIPDVGAGDVLEHYERWLGRQALAGRTRANYRRWVGELVAELDAGGELDAFLAFEGAD